MNRLRHGLLSLLLLTLARCEAEPDEPSTGYPDHIEPEVCEPPQAYFYPGCEAPTGDAVIPAPGCYIECWPLERCPLGYECREVVFHPCFDLLCNACSTGTHLCMRPDQIIGTADDP